MKYNIEGEVDFYKELYDFSNDNIDNIENSSELNKCLITYTDLTNNFVELNCGHKFNYAPLYKDIYNYKKKFNNMEQSKFKLKINEIRCPYCRKIQSELLPYYDFLPYPKEHGVNYLDSNKLTPCSFVNSNHQCQYETIINDSSGNTFINKCFNYGCIQYKLKEKYNITNKYCNKHKCVILKELKQKEKDAIKLEKLKLKEELKKSKEESKKLEKLEKLEKQKKQLKNVSGNIIISNNITITSDNITETQLENGCITILKTGPRKGEKCSTSIYNNCLCKRHFNLQNKYIKV
jgi:hypothetical protein